MKVILLVVTVVACGGKPTPAPAPAPAPAEPRTSGSAQPTLRKEDGVLEFEGKEMATDAETQMAERCGAGNFTILREGEENVLKERVYRIHYRCN